MGLFRRLATLIFVLAIPIALISSTVRFVFNEPRVYRYSIDEFDAVQTTGVPRSELLRATNELRAFLNSNNAPLRIQVTTADNRSGSLFNPREVTHLTDVRRLVSYLNKVQVASSLYVLIYVAAVVLWAREVSLRGLAVAIASGSLLTLAAVGGGAAATRSGFDQTWLRLHELLFTDDYKFNPVTDRLIQIFPADFWQSIVFFVGVLIAAEAGLLLIGAGIYLGVTSGKPARQNRVLRTTAA